MTRHFNYDAERIAVVKGIRKSVLAILIVVLAMLAYAVYRLIK